MAKFLNNEDGKYLKSFMLDKVESIVLYPSNYFNDFSVTTLIVILSKQVGEQIRFLRIIDENLLTEPEEIKNILLEDQTTQTGDYSLKVLNRDILPESNWKLHLLDPNDKYETLNSNELFENLNTFFNIERGNAETKGATTILFPNFEDDRFNMIHDIHRGYGIKGNRQRRNLIFNEDDLNYERAIHFPMNYDDIIIPLYTTKDPYP